MKFDNVKGIFFDIGYTLCEPVTGNWRFTTKFFEVIDKCVLENLPLERIESALQKSSQYLNDNHFLKTLDEEYKQNIMAYSIIAEEIPELNISMEKVRDIAYDRTFNMSNYRFYSDIKQTIEILYKNYKLGIISDTWPSADEMLKEASIYQYFSSFTYSCYLGTFKPDRNMYLDAIDKMEFNPEQTIYIDDSIKNLEAAKEIGITPILITTKVNGWDGINISKISELIDILKD